jgi:putative tricarboxylic transport membrane protein
MNPRRIFAAFIALLAATAAAQTPGWKPEKNVEIVIGLTPGSSQDRTGRALQKIWQDKNLLGVSSTVVNRVGGGGTIAWNYLAQHAGDAHYVQIASPTLLTNRMINPSAHDFRDFTPLGLLGKQHLVIATRADASLKSGRELMERLKRDPGLLSFGVNSAGSNLHIFVAALAQAAGVDPKKVKIVVFQGAELMTAALGGHVDVISTVTSNVLPHVQSGKLRILGIGSARRLGGSLADVPTWKEQGVDVLASNWASVVGPKGLSAAQIAYWDRLLAATVATDEWKADLARNVWEPDYLNSAETTKFFQSEDGTLRSAMMGLGLVK